MAQVTVNQVAGLFVQQNSFSAPDGALERASNVICAQDSLCRKRRGFSELSDAIPNAVALTEYLESLFVSTISQIGKVNLTTGAVSYLTDSSSLWSINTHSKPRFAQSSGNLYVATGNGVLKIESTTASLMRAGVPRGLDLSVTLSTNAGILAPDAQVAYRIAFGRLDANSNKVIGAPSELTVITNLMNRTKTASNALTVITVTSTSHGLSVSDTIVIKNSAGSGTPANCDGTWSVASVPDANTFTFSVTTTPGVGGVSSLDWGVYKKPTLNFTVPDGALSTEYFYQIFRGTQSSSDTTSPTEDLQLINEGNLTAGEVSNKYVDYIDIVDDLFKGAYCYTNPNTGQGIAQANDQPPFARDICTFKDMVFFANTQTRYTKEVNLISITSLSGNTFKITCNGTTRTYTGGATEVVASQQFLVYSSGTTSQNIDKTAKSLCKCINRDSSSEVYAYYVSGIDDVPGKMIIVSESFDDNFSLTVGASGISGDFQPTLPTSGTTVEGSNAESPNAVYVSKLGESEAVPAVNYLYVGSKSFDILRIIPLRDSVLVIKEDGVFAIRGSSPASLTVQALDTTVICKAADSVAVLNNQCYFVSSQGVAAASESSVSIFTRDIEPLLTSVTGSSYFATLSTAAAYESEGLYILTTIEPNTVPEEFSQTVSSASLTSNVVSLTLSASVTSSQAQMGDVIILEGFTSTLEPLNGTHVISDVTSNVIQFPLINTNIASASGNGNETVSAIGANCCYVFNTKTSRWSTWTTYFKDAVVLSSDDKLYMLNKETVIKKERKNQNKLDFCEDEHVLNIVTVSSDNLSATANSPTGTIEVGDVFYVDEVATKIRSIVTVGASTVYYFDSPVNFSDGATGTLLKYIESELIFAPLTAGDVATWKQFSEFSALFRTKSCTGLDIAFTSNQTAISDTVSWQSVSSDEGWGNLPWGNFPWGLDEGLNLKLVTETNQPVRTLIPASCQRATWIQARLTHKTAAESFDLQAFSYKARAYGSRTSR